jgi:hypothetical protein
MRPEYVYYIIIASVLGPFLLLTMPFGAVIIARDVEIKNWTPAICDFGELRNIVYYDVDRPNNSHVSVVTNAYPEDDLETRYTAVVHFPIEGALKTASARQVRDYLLVIEGVVHCQLDTRGVDHDGYYEAAIGRVGVGRGVVLIVLDFIAVVAAITAAILCRFILNYEE